MRYTNYLSKIALTRTLNQVDIGNEVVISLLNDKRSLFKNLLEQNSPHEKGIKNILDKQSLLKYSPRSIEIANGVTKFFKGVTFFVWQKLMQAVIGWMKQGFAEVMKLFLGNKLYV
uniref:Uncharacterized protein n=1 Tax=Meloidogyne floridensis TaxID=298350 RepID=A0A915NXT6_9BILA